MVTVIFSVGLKEIMESFHLVSFRDQEKMKCDLSDHLSTTLSFISKSEHYKDG